MPIKIPDDLPARQTLEAEGVTVMGEADAVRQDIRPLQIGLLNLMPDKVRTETQLARLLGSTPLQIELTLVRMTDHVSRNTSQDHMEAFYRSWEAVREERFDGFIITGAPVERMPYEDVAYWDEMGQILEWTQTNVHRTLTICWAAQAALYHFHAIPKRTLDAKAFGVFPHATRLGASPFLRGFADTFGVPVSRWTEVTEESIAKVAGLEILASSDVTGPCLVEDAARRTLHMFNHLEYDTETLAKEYHRDGGSQMPFGYFPSDDPSRSPENSWRAHAHLLIGNWINAIYQTTPFDMNAIGSNGVLTAA